MLAEQRAPLLELRPEGLYCPDGDFFIDPARGVERAVITHAHADHARSGSRTYLTAADGVRVLRQRLGARARISGVDYGVAVRHGDVEISFHPAGHILGSAQVAVSRGGERWVVSGDYKRDPDPTCRPFEPVPCHTFITESTFALPIYRWRPQNEIFAEMNAWWSENRAAGCHSVLFVYSLGKAQRILAGVDPSIGPIVAHGSVLAMIEAYRAEGIALPRVRSVEGKVRESVLALIPPTSREVLSRLCPYRSAMVSGWMTVRRHRRGRSFALSDHADWDGLLAAITETGAEQVLVTHGYTEALTRHLNEIGRPARTLQ